MRVVLAFLEFLEGKHGIHANPFNYTLLLNNPPALCVATTPCDLIPGQALRGTERAASGLCWPLRGSPGSQSLAGERLGAPVLPGANRIPSSRARVSNCCK